MPPAINGLGDYSSLLGSALEDQHGITTRYIIGGIASQPSEDRPVATMPAGRTGRQLARALDEACAGCGAVVLQYSGYGYALKGAPYWILAGLREWKRTNRGALLVTVFHELFATGRIVSSAYWLSSFQKRLAGNLARMSDFSIVSREENAELLCRLSGIDRSKVQVLPIFSNFGEPKSPLPIAERPRRIAIIGTAGRRAAVYQGSTSLLLRLCDEWEIEQVLDIGPSLTTLPRMFGKAAVHSFGISAPEEVSRQLLGCIGGVIDYPPAILAKSGIFAAYSAHRLTPIVLDGSRARRIPERSSDPDGLTSGKHYFLADSTSATIDLDQAESIAAAAYEWYQPHAKSAHSDAIARIILGDTAIDRTEPARSKLA